MHDEGEESGVLVVVVTVDVVEVVVVVVVVGVVVVVVFVFVDGDDEDGLPPSDLLKVFRPSLPSACSLFAFSESLSRNCARAMARQPSTNSWYRMRTALTSHHTQWTTHLAYGC